jgi:hypothetical protein
MRWIVLSLVLASCSGIPSALNPLSGGTNVAANTQIGKENRQSVVSLEQKKEVTAGRDVITKEVETGTVENLDITNTNIPPWVILLLILGWLLPTPTEIVRGTTDFILRLFGRKDNPKHTRFK